MAQANARADKAFEDALVAQQSGNFEQALDLFQACLCANPDHAQAWHWRGLVESRLGRHFNALCHFQNSLEIEERQDVWCNAGIVLGAMEQLSRAEGAFLKALEFGEAYEPHVNLADLYIRTMQLEKCEHHLRIALKIRPNEPTAHGNLGKVLIALGRWKEGHRETLHRHKRDIPLLRKRFQFWEGQNLTNKVLILYPEGGFGDEISNVRNAKQVAERNPKCKVYLWVRPPLYRLFKHSLSTDNLICIPQYDMPPESDTPNYCLGLSDLPLYLDMKPETVPYSEGYLSPPWGPPFELPEGFKVGLCWLSGKRPLQAWTDRVAQAKSIQLTSFTWLLERKDVKWVSLQFDRANPDVMRRLNLTSQMGDIEDFADTARLINQLDMVISVDTAVAHLAGAMGKPVWNLVRFDEIVTYIPGTNMYKSMKHYRQKAPNDWSSTLEALFVDFDKMMAARDTQLEAAE